MTSTKMKAMCAAYVAVLALGICPVSPAAAGANSVHIMGDADGDGEVSITDAQNVLKTYVNAMSKKETVDASADPASDTNIDGVIDLLDATNILKYYCRTLSGDKPLWSEFRAVSYISGCPVYDMHTVTYVDENGKEYGSYEEYGEPIRYEEYDIDGMFLEIGAVSGKPGDNVVIPVYVSGAPYMVACQLYLNNSAGAELLDIRNYIGRMRTKTSGSAEDARTKTVMLTDANPDPEWGVLVWLSPTFHNVEIEDGTVIAEYIYHIPDDSVPGTVYPLSIDKIHSRFFTDGSESGHKDCDTQNYKYTLLNGAIYVE